MPSTMMNILDVLENWKQVTNNNEDISTLYIAYQVESWNRGSKLKFYLSQMGIMVGTFIGPGGIYMVIAGAISFAFGISNLTALLGSTLKTIVFRY